MESGLRELKSRQKGIRENGFSVVMKILGLRFQG